MKTEDKDISNNNNLNKNELGSIIDNLSSSKISKFNDSYGFISNDQKESIKKYYQKFAKTVNKKNLIDEDLKTAQKFTDFLNDFNMKINKSDLENSNMIFTLIFILLILTKTKQDFLFTKIYFLFI